MDQYRAMTTATAALSRSEIDSFHRNGYLGPYSLCRPEEMAAIAKLIETEVLATSGPNPHSEVQARHLDHRIVYDLLTNPNILDRLRGLLGNDLVLWASYFFNKEPGGLEIPWHQDANYWPIEPPLNVSIWLAIDRVTTENSCVQVIPGSHRTLVNHIPVTGDKAFGEEADPAFFDAGEAIDMELDPGQFFIFNERLLHHSEPNRSQRRRLGLSGRYTVPLVSILDQDSLPLYPGHACVLVSGVDIMGHNRMAEPPAR
jgi:non-haem Fe2+, alpha-ketoglutarate-dependent halogenase